MRGFLIAIMPVFASAAQTDIVPRTANFVIFAAILYFLVAKHIKRLYCQKINRIESQLSEIEKHLNDAKTAKDEAIKSVEAANNEAKRILEVAEAQIEVEKKTLLRGVEEECTQLERALDEKITLDKKAAKKAISLELLENILNSEVNLKEQDLLGAIDKRLSNG